MPIFFLVVGILLVAAAINNRTGELGDLVKGDFTGPNNFVLFALAILIIGALGYVKPLKPVSNAFLALVIIVMILANNKGGSGGFFTKFMQALNPHGGGFNVDTNSITSPTNQLQDMLS